MKLARRRGEKVKHKAHDGFTKSTRIIFVFSVIAFVPFVLNILLRELRVNVDR